MKRAVVTGATGFVGACLARRLLRDGHEVHLLLRPPINGRRIADVEGDLRLHIVDVNDRAAVLRTLRELRPEWVFNLMAHGAYSSQTDPDEIVRTNLLGTIHLLDAAQASGAEAFVQAGSSSEYGFQDHAPREGEPVAPNSLYAVSKVAATHYGQMIARQRDLQSCAPVVFGVRTLRGAHPPHSDAIRHGLAGRLPPLVAPETARDFIYVEDVEEACVRAAQIGGQRRGAVYNVGTGQQTTIRQAVEALRRALPIADEPVWGTMGGRSGTPTFGCPTVGRSTTSSASPHAGRSRMACARPSPG